MIHAVPVILCGGSGTRLWPLSRAGFPKQFLVLSGVHSLYQLAAKRLQSLSDSAICMQGSLIVAGEEHRFLALEQLRELQIGAATLILEPSARNTAAALTLAALHAMEQDADPVLVASPADQHIGDEVGYAQSLRIAIREASSGSIVILGITPNRPEIGYGYIRCGVAAEPAEVREVKQFVEKPELELAEQYLASGEYAWNSGMFVLKASVWLKALSRFRPDILQACQKAWSGKAADPMHDGLQFIRPHVADFAQVPSESVDYAVMEKCPGSSFPIRMVDMKAQWSDVGAWDAVWQVGTSDLQGNVTRGDVLLDDSHHNFIYASSRLVSAVGVKDLAIVETADAVLVCAKASSQQVKNIVTQLQKKSRSESNLHRKVHRPWGWYDSIDEGECFKVKRINVKPGASLSLQKHAHRAEHWIVVKGQALVTCGSKVETLVENQSTYIPLGEVHSLKNPGITDLEIIEVQSGSYLGEDDIVRLQDNYGRIQS
jgi:mannose-1-phosphate guanylyltransferase / mannose-6-phosphate isomerase